MLRKLANPIALLFTACGGAPVAQGVDGALDPTPLDVADDDRAYQLAADCAGLPTWSSLLPMQQLDKVAAVSAREAWVVATGELLHLEPSGTIAREPLEDVSDVWRCPGVTWAVGARGLVARKPDGGAWERLDPGVTWDLIDGGAGCDGDVWIGAGADVRVHDGTGWRTIALEPTLHGDGSMLRHDAARVRAVSSYRVATSNYGATLVYVPERDVFMMVGYTDDLISDAIVFRDGTGATLYHGHALAFDHTPRIVDVPSPLHGRRAARRADDDLWIAQGDVVRRFDGATLTDEPSPVYAHDVDARFDAVWAVGYEGAAVRTAAGWCHVAVVPPAP